MSTSRLGEQNLVYARERFLFALMVLFGLAVYGGLAYASWLSLATGSMIAFYAVLFLVMVSWCTASCSGVFRGTA